MNDEPTDAGQKRSQPPGHEHGDDHQFRILNIVDLPSRPDDMPAPGPGAANAVEIVVAAYAAGTFSKAFLETLGRRTADNVADLPKRVGDLVRRKVRRKDETVETHIGTGDGRTATIVVTDDLPDEARLALLDLDVTSEELQGKLLRWDGEAMAWRPQEPGKTINLGLRAAVSLPRRPRHGTLKTLTRIHRITGALSGSLIKRVPRSSALSRKPPGGRHSRL